VIAYSLSLDETQKANFLKAFNVYCTETLAITKADAAKASGEAGFEVD
jgi:hypothetical protein